MKTLFTILSLSLCLSSFAQLFSGEITYQIKIIPKNDKVDLDETIKNQHGELAKYLITSKYYKSTYFKGESFNYSYTYHDETKRIYDDYADKEYITYRDSQKANTKFKASKLYKDSIETILGHECYMLKVETDRGKSKNYYSDDIRVNPEDFKGHLVGNWYQKMKEVNGSILLKSVQEYENYFKIQEAIKIVPREVKKEEFLLPKKLVAASYSALDVHPNLHKASDISIRCYMKKVNNVSKKNGEKVKIYVSLIVTAEGQIKHVEPTQKDEYGFYKTAVDIVQNCGLKFDPGQINEKLVSSKIYFPITFFK